MAIRYLHSSGVHPPVPLVDNATVFGNGLRVLGEKRMNVEVTLCRRLASHATGQRTLSK